MKHGWEIKKLGEVATFINGDRGKNYPSQNDFVKEGIPFINAGHLVDGSVDFSSMNYISEEKYEKLGSGKIWNGDLLFCLRGSLGKKAIVENLDKAAIASSLVIIRCIDIFNRYLYYYLDSPIVEDLIFQSNNGSSQPNLSAKSVASFPIPVPPLSVQSSIVSELDCINGILEKKREQIKELDALAQSIFYDMFGDPIQNEKGWEVKKLGDVCTSVNYGTSMPAVEGGKYKYLRMNNITYDGFLDLKDLKYISVPDNEIEKCVVRRGDVLFNRTNSKELVGKTALFDLDEDMIIAGYIIRVRVDTEKVLPLYIVRYMNTKYIKSYLSNLCKGAVNQANINSKELRAIPLFLPPLSLQQAFAAKIEAIEKQKELVKRSIAETETLLASRMQHYFEA